MGRVFRTTLHLSVAALMTASLSLSQALAADPIHLRMTVLGGVGAGDGTVGAIKAWNDANPDIQVDLELQSDELNWQATAPTTMFAASDGPDLTWWWCSPSFQYKEMIAANLLAPLDDIYANGGYPEGTVQYFTEPDGHKYGVNTDVVWTPYVYYNKTIFADLGLTPPTTWDELYAIAAKVRGAGFQPMVTLYDYGMVNHLVDGLMMRSWTQDEYNALLRNWSPTSTEAERAHKWTDPNSIRIFQTLKDIVDKGFAADGFAGIIDDEVAKSLFTSGKAAMYQTGSWAGAGMLKQDQFEVGYFYYPPIQDVAYGPVGSWVPNCYIAFNHDKVDAAKKVITFLASKDGALAYAKASGLTIGRTDVTAEDVSFLAPMVSQMAADVGKMGAPALYESSVPPDILNTLKRTAGEVLTGVSTPEEAGQAMEDAYEEARNK
ncbi:MAG: extracellular solute-binding protein [Devosia nanyangense]|uniref:Extracellular solute-binding protein n=1 Tax=Devosia nanyangense TaxID=1228055 RepID=A0A933L1T9_9HYPH|nr:extracellular solute-binding protein [Devosia nanyangense]